MKPLLSVFAVVSVMAIVATNPLHQKAAITIPSVVPVVSPSIPSDAFFASDHGCKHQVGTRKDNVFYVPPDMELYMCYGNDKYRTFKVNTK